MKHNMHKRSRLGETEREAEARDTWGSGHEWRESHSKAQGRSRLDWDRIMEEGRSIAESIAASMDRGADDEAVQAGVKAYHDYIGKHFYTCPATTFQGLAELWGYDERFASYWESIAPGLTSFMQDAVNAYVENLLLSNECTLGGK